jgi:hypothetical protein
MKATEEIDIGKLREAAKTYNRATLRQALIVIREEQVSRMQQVTDEPKSQFQTELAQVCELQAEYYKERGIVF